MYIAKASSVTGPYTVDAEAYRLLTTQSRRDTYFTRFFRSPDGLLVNHQFVRRDGEAFFAPLKRAVVDSGGHLRLHYWDGNERLKGKPISIGADSSIRAAGLSNWTTDGTTIDARQSLGASVIPLEPKVDLDKGVVLEGSLTIGRPKKAFAGAGVFIEQSDGRGTGMLLQTNGVTEFGIYGKSNLGPGFVVDDTVETGISPLREYRFRLLVRRDLAELYLDDQLVQCYSLPIESYSGRLGLFVADGDAKFSNLHAWEMTLAGE